MKRSYREVVTIMMMSMMVAVIVSGIALLPIVVIKGENHSLEREFDAKQTAYLVRKAKWRTFIELMRKYHATGNVKWMALAQATANFIQYEEMTKLNVCYCGGKEQPGGARIY